MWGLRKRQSVGGVIMSRIDGRKNDQLRPIEIIPGINKFAEGSCLIRCGNTQVLCCASVEEGAVSYTHLRAHET